MEDGKHDLFMDIGEEIRLRVVSLYLIDDFSLSICLFIHLATAISQLLVSIEVLGNALNDSIVFTVNSDHLPAFIGLVVLHVVPSATLGLLQKSQYCVFTVQ